MFSRMKPTATLTRLLPLLVLLGSGGALLGALFFQYGMDLAPCALCHDQRYAHVGALLAALLALLSAGQLRLLLTGLAGLALLTGAGIAGYHVGIEQGWWPGPAGCSAPAFDGLSIDELRSALESAPVVRCDEVPWSFLGISMAGYNFLLSLALGLLVLGGAARRWRTA